MLTAETAADAGLVCCCCCDRVCVLCASQAVLNIISNPVNSTVPIAAETLKRMGVYDKRKLLGVTTLDVVRAGCQTGPHFACCVCASWEGGRGAEKHRLGRAFWGMDLLLSAAAYALVSPKSADASPVAGLFVAVEPMNACHRCVPRPSMLRSLAWM